MGSLFLPFTEFVEDNVKEEQVVYVIGHVVVGDVVHGERKGKKNRRMVVELTDIEIYKCFKHLLLKPFFINEEIPEIDDFRLLARVGDDTSSLQVSNLTSKSSQALEEKSFLYGTKYVNLEQLMDVIEVRVGDDSACASFLMFDRDVFNIADRSAYVLEEEKATKSNAAEYPDDLNKLV
nr:hypothetical protein [Tanacetum cinerariifolium]